LKTVTHNEEKDIVYVVDDGAENIKILGNVLESNGYEPVVFLRAKDALESICNEKPELILLDIMMPEMDGYEMCADLKADVSTKDIPIIFLTGKTDTDSLVKGFDLGAADYIKKPFRSAELLARIKTHIGFKKAREEIEMLKGLIPICAQCKKIRDDKGYWNQVDIYLEKHSGATFSHGICPDCAEALYGDQHWYKKKKAKDNPF